MKANQLTLLKKIAMVIVAAVMLLVMIRVAGGSGIETLSKLVSGSFGGTKPISGTLAKMTPLLFLGIAVFIALRAGLFNIGADGQFVVGACAGAAVTLSIGGVLGIVLGAIAGAIAGAFWALPAGLIKALRNGHEVVSTIMLNAIAASLARFLAKGPMRGSDQSSESTSLLSLNSRMPTWELAGAQIPLALLLALLLCSGVGWWLYKTVSGYELRATGANPTAAKFAGIAMPAVTIRAMVISGAIAGLAGALQVSQFEFRFYPSISPGYGFDALGVALLAGTAPLALIATGLFFGALAKGGLALGAIGLSKYLTSIITAMIIIVFAVISAQKGSNQDA